MNVTCVHHTIGGRGHRLALALAGAGHRVRILYRLPWDDMPALLPSLDAPPVQWVDDGDLLAYVRRDTWTDVWHVSQNPRDETMAWAVMMGRQNPDARVVWDVRDLGSMAARCIYDGPERPTSPSMNVSLIWEDLTIRQVDGILHVSPDCQRWAEWLHPESAEAPSCVLWSAVSEADLPPLDGPRAGLVYCGGLGMPAKAGNGTVRDTRDYSIYLEAIREARPWGAEPIVVQSDHPTVALPCQELRRRGFETRSRVPQDRLLHALAEFRWGLWGNPVMFQPLLRAALPNKLFEYLGAGVVPVVINCPASADLVEGYGVGLGGERWGDVRERMTEEHWQRCFDNLGAVRHTFTMEAQVGAVVEVYEEALRRPARWVGMPEWVGMLKPWDPGAREAEEVLLG